MLYYTAVNKQYVQELLKRHKSVIWVCSFKAWTDLSPLLNAPHAFASFHRDGTEPGGGGGEMLFGLIALFGLITPGRVTRKKNWCDILRFYRLNLG